MRGPDGTIVVNFDSPQRLTVVDQAAVAAVVASADETCTLFASNVQMNQVEGTAAEISGLVFDTPAEFTNTDGQACYVDPSSVDGLTQAGDEVTVIHLTGGPILTVVGDIDTVSAAIYADHPSEGLEAFSSG